MSLETASKILGGNAPLARALGVSPQAVGQWLRDQRTVPPERCVQIETLTEGKVTRRDLRPGDWWRLWPELVDLDHPVPETSDAA